MQEQYDTIKRARALLAATPKSTARKSTVDDYRGKIKRLANRMEVTRTFDAVINEALKTRKKSSWQAYRAALLFTARNGLETYLAEQDTLQRGMKAAEALGQQTDWSPWLSMITKVEDSRRALQTVLDASLPIEGRLDRHSKRQDMKGLPSDWREQIVARMPTYSMAALTAAVTGCRPAELVSGVKLSIADGMLTAYILGAKVDVEKGKGQEWRKLSWSVDHPSGLVQEILRQVRFTSGERIVQIANASNFSKSMSNAGKRLWPKRKATITPYCMRHQVAADMKADGGLSSTEISAALGHVSDVTKSTYGHANMGRGGGVAPTKVSAARTVKMKTPSKAASKKVKL